MKILMVLPILGLAGCAVGAAGTGGVIGAATTAIGLTNQVVSTAQLVCNIGSAYYAVNDQLGNPVLVSGKAEADVKALCPIINGLPTVPVAPPAAAVVTPATVSVVKS